MILKYVHFVEAYDCTDLIPKFDVFYVGVRGINSAVTWSLYTLAFLFALGNPKLGFHGVYYPFVGNTGSRLVSKVVYTPAHLLVTLICVD